MHLDAFRELLDQQAGVVARRQLVEGGATDADIRRWARRRELRRVHTGVYVNHTGPLTWMNRAWVAVLFHWPAALTAESCVNRAGHPIHVAVDASRTPTLLPGVRTHRLVGLEDRVQWNLGPPRSDLKMRCCRCAADVRPGSTRWPWCRMPAAVVSRPRRGWQRS